MEVRKPTSGRTGSEKSQCTTTGQIQAFPLRADMELACGVELAWPAGVEAQTKGMAIMDVRYINPFIAAVKHVFKTMMSTDIMISKPRLKAPDEGNSDVSAVIGFSGDAAGCVILCFRTDSAVKTASKFSGAPLTPQSPDFSDALGELANMVAGQAKAQFEGLSVSISLPSVIIGAEHEVLQSKVTPRLVIPCDSEFGRFAVEVAMVVQTGAGASAAAPVAAVAG